MSTSNLPENFDDTCTMVKGLVPTSVDLEAIKETVARLTREGCTQKQIVDALLRCRKLSKERLLTALVTELDVTTDTSKNRARWLRRFRDGEVPYLCPECGFSGGGEDFYIRGGMSGTCPRGHVSYVKTFERSWAPGEYESFQTRLDAEYQVRQVQRKDAARKDKEVQDRVTPIFKALWDERPQGELYSDFLPPILNDDARDLWDAIKDVVVADRPDLDDETIIALWYPLFDKIYDYLQDGDGGIAEHRMVAATIIDSKNSVEALRQLVAGTIQFTKGAAQ
jgi:hypothetical protein